MKKLYFLTLLFLSISSLFSQEGFEFSTKKKKITIPFQLSNNLIIMPLEINGVKLNFLLDTGVEKTVLFSLSETDSVQFNNIEKIKIKGLGAGKSIDALHSKKNRIVINELVDRNHEVYIILDQDVNFSSQLGIPVHGIIGYYFFKNNFIEINYKRKQINVYKNAADFSAKKLKQYDAIPISIEIEKPYIEATASLNNKEVKTKLLVDSGGSDALWLFENNNNIQSPDTYFNDLLGKGFSGDIYGKRSRIDKFKIGNNELLLPTISFPDSTSLKNVNMVEGRNGSVGSEILKRFNVLFDYANQKMYLKKNADFYEPFNYNMSGIEVQHNGLQWIKEEVELKTNFVNSEISLNSIISDSPKSVRYQFQLKQAYEITNVRKDSPADLAGIQKGDRIVRINGSEAYHYKLQEINQLMQSEEGRLIVMEVERDGKIIRKKFQLKKIL